ncbi:hypothetical protein [Neisseria yangbaofengii]|uniref:hypothetical protein n=1 Tax=Neisseria yangbaofengii TaxID=2709396 RepID=UPI0013EA9FB0|nr:hypothetical protein [Neisseria yangbaofengii]
MKQNNQNIDLTKVDLTQLDSESMNQLIDAFKGTKHYKKNQKIVKIFGSILLLILLIVFAPIIREIFTLISKAF